MDRAQIQAEWDKFIEYPSDDKRIVTTTSALLFAEHIAKLQATQEPAQAGELPDEREAFEATVLKDNHHAVLTKRRNGCYQDDELQSMWWAWQARAALREKEQAK